jgi:hypothetical protein
VISRFRFSSRRVIRKIARCPDQTRQPGDNIVPDIQPPLAQTRKWPEGRTTSRVRNDWKRYVPKASSERRGCWTASVRRSRNPSDGLGHAENVAPGLFWPGFYVVPVFGPLCEGYSDLLEGLFFLFTQFSPLLLVRAAPGGDRQLGKLGFCTFQIQEPPDIASGWINQAGRQIALWIETSKHHEPVGRLVIENVKELEPAKLLQSSRTQWTTVTSNVAVSFAFQYEDLLHDAGEVDAFFVEMRRKLAHRERLFLCQRGYA